ncbi:MAG: efflux RND transporter periplasmic adaptor subunit [Myxococcota bacterium]
MSPNLGRSRARRSLGPLLISLCLSGLACSEPSSAPPAASGPRLAVQVAEVLPAPKERPVLLHGVTRASARAALSFTVPGRLAARKVDLGSEVEVGDPIAFLDAAPFEHDLDAAQARVRDLTARLQQVRGDRARLESLDVGQSVTASELEGAKAQVTGVAATLEGARATAAQAERRRDEATLRAPIGGSVVAVLAEPGEAVAAGQPIAMLSGAGAVEIEVQAPEPVWAHMSVGDPAEVDLPGIGRSVTGVVTSVATAARTAGLMPLVVTIQDPDVAAGLTANVMLSVPVDGDVLIPISAIVDPVGGTSFVYVLEEEHVARRPIRPQHLVRDEVVVRGELEVADRVVVAGQQRLIDGDVVEVTP